MINDLAAPVKTLLGAYGTHTIVNDNRLVNILCYYHFPNDTYSDKYIYMLMAKKPN
jgi:hypothetical protein